MEAIEHIKNGMANLAQPIPHGANLCFLAAITELEKLEENRWIPVSERLPEKDRSKRGDSEASCWVHITDGEQCLKAFYYHKENYWQGCFGMAKDTITHWRPIVLPKNEQ